MAAYYNEHDAFAAEWLRQLIKKGVIANGEVDERNLQKVQSSDLAGFTQCHFFAGIGVWSYALRLAGWPDTKPVWTGSCPCQPFSVSGKRGGASDERHVWPVWFALIRESRPELIFGEQVASDDGLAWLDLVSTDLDGQDYTLGTVDTCAAGFGAPHIRQRLYFVAESEHTRLHRQKGVASLADSDQSGQWLLERDSSISVGLADTKSGRDYQRTPRREWRDASQSIVGIAHGFVADNSNARLEGSAGQSVQGRGTGLASDGISGSVLQEHAIEPRLERFDGNESDGNQPRRLREDSIGSTSTPSLTNGFWRDAEWLWCRDQKYRAVEPGTFPLVDGATARVGRLRGYGNALVAEQAKAFIQAYLEVVSI